MMVMLSERGFTKRDALVGELHYAVKNISDEAFGYVLEVAKSFSVDKKIDVGDRMVNQTRVVITGHGEARLVIVWSYDGKRFLSSGYARSSTGKWTADTAIQGIAWVVKLEEMYQQKLREIEATLLQES
jgi:hypothetical protein